MAEFVTVTKGGRRKQVIVGRQQRQAEADGWELAGTKRIETETGERTKETGEALKSIAAGDATLVSEDVIKKRRGAEFVEEQFGDEGIQAFGEGALGSIPLVGGHAVRAIRDISEGDAGAAEQAAIANPIASTAGQVTGTILQAAAPFALAGKAGKVAGLTPGGLISRAATAVGKKGSSKAARFAAEGMVDAAAWTVAQNHANAVIADTPINAEMLVAGLPMNMIMGGVAGGVIGKLSSKLDADKIASKAAAVKAAEPDAVAAQLTKLEDTARSTKQAVEVARLDKAKPAREFKALQAEAKAAKTELKEFTKLKKSTTGFDDKFAIPGKGGDISDAVVAEANILKRVDDTQAAAAGAQAAVDADGVQRLTQAEDALKAKHAVEDFKAANPKQPKAAAPTEAKQPSGLVAQISDATVGRMSRTIDWGKKKISSSVERFVKTAGKPRRGTIPAASTILNSLRFDADLGVKPEKGNRKQEMMRVSRELDELMKNPEPFKQRMSKAFRSQGMLKPGLTQATTDLAMQRVQFLHGLVPRSPNSTPLSNDKWLPSDTAIDKFTRIAAAAQDPYSILDDLESGRLTQEAVDTVKQLYPEIYHDIQMELISDVERLKEIGWKKQLLLGILFQAPTTEELEPAYGKIMQDNYAIRAQEQEQSGGGGGQFSTPGSNQKAIQSTQTTSQRLESK